MAQGKLVNKSFRAIILSLQANLDILNKNDIKLYDSENPEYYVSAVYYSQDDDRVYIEYQKEE